MSEIDSVLEAFSKWSDAKAETRRCVESCSEDADYFCSDQITNEDKATKALGDALEMFVQRIIQRSR